MAEPRDRHTPEYNETTDPRNPPNSVLQPEVRRFTTWSFVLPLVALAFVAGILWVFWLGQPPRPRDANRTGTPTEAVGTAGERKPGGANPNPKPDSTKEELEFRGGKQ